MLHAGLLLSVVTISYLIIQPVVGSLTDKFDPVITLRVGMLSCITTSAITFITGSLLISILAGIGNACTVLIRL